MQQDGAGGGGGEAGNIHLLLSILADGEEQARLLGELLPDDPRLGAEHYRGVARQLQCTLRRAVSVAKAMEAAASRGTDSPRTSADEGSGGGATAAVEERRGVCKRRKGLPRWTAKFRVPDASLEATPDDGFSWRKYGQKDILGAKFPRGYYRCTYRAAQGCPATKQVQRSDSDLCVFDVTYQGVHTCHQKDRHAAAGAAPPHDIGQPPPQPDPSTELLPCFNDCLKVEATETVAPPLHVDDQADHGGVGASVPFSFLAPPAADDAVAACFSSSPTAAGSSYYAVPHCLQVPAAGSYEEYGYDMPGARMRGAESELGEVVSKATSSVGAAADRSAAGFGYSLYLHGEFDPHLPFAPGGPRHH